jgi:PEP-CTERM motif
MKLASLVLTTGMVLFTGFSQAATTITFEEIPSYSDSILAAYNGGTNGSRPPLSGPNYGISFSASAVTLANDADFQYFSNAPSGNVVMLDFDGSSFMNVATGFVGIASFGYSSNAAALGAVKIFSGLNGTGTQLASFNLASNSESGCAVQGAPFCNFNVLSSAFSGIAYSMTFGGNSNGVLFDDITVSAVPEASTWLTMLVGLGAIGFMRRRSSK